MWWNLGKRKTKVQFNPAKDDISEQARGFVHSVLLLRIRKPSAHDPKLIDSQLVQPQPKKTYLCMVGWHGRYVEVVCIRMHPLCAQSIRALILTRTDITFAASSADAMQGCDGEGGEKNVTANFLSMKCVLAVKFVLTVKCFFFFFSFGIHK